MGYRQSKILHLRIDQDGDRKRPVTTLRTPVNLHFEIAHHQVRQVGRVTDEKSVSGALVTSLQRYLAILHDRPSAERLSPVVEYEKSGRFPLPIAVVDTKIQGEGCAVAKGNTCTGLVPLQRDFAGGDDALLPDRSAWLLHQQELFRADVDIPLVVGAARAQAPLLDSRAFHVEVIRAQGKLTLARLHFVRGITEVDRADRAIGERASLHLPVGREELVGHHFLIGDHLVQLAGLLIDFDHQLPFV